LIPRYLALYARGVARRPLPASINVDGMTTYSDEPTSGASTYTLGHSDAEVQRLLLLGRIYDDHTEHALRVAGLRPGMRVLDVGCGPGDVSIVASRLVGSTGTVLGVDAAADIIDFARIRATGWLPPTFGLSRHQSKTSTWTSPSTP
jgi:2-polyprenyl-3-methyl-5-hydroxy-6-metoxy-1,4-benzoquinol methylase